MAAEQFSAAAQGGFVQASSATDWYKNLKRYGSCLRLHDLLEEQRELIHQLGPEGITVLHKGVEHGCVKLVKFILVDMFDGEGNCSCSLHGHDYPCLTREGLLRKSCSNGSTAVNIAVVSGSPKMVLLLKWAIDMSSSKNSEVTEEIFGEVYYRDITKIRSSFMSEKGLVEEGTESTNDTENSLEVPDVKDDAIDRIYETDRESESNNLIPKVYHVIEGILNENWGTDEELMDMLKDGCKKDVDFEFVPVTHIFLHFLFGITYWRYYIGNVLESPFRDFRGRFVKRIFEACNARDDEEGVDRGTMLKTLCSILDPRGRTFLHAAFENETFTFTPILLELMEEATGGRDERGVASSILAECVNARDGAGRTILHLRCIHDHDDRNNDGIWEKLDWNVILSPLCPGELEALQMWCFPLYLPLGVCLAHIRPLHLAAIFNSTRIFDLFLSFSKEKKCKILNSACKLWLNGGIQSLGPFQIAAFFGRTKILEQILKHHKKFNSLCDKGLEADDPFRLPAIHRASQFGQVEAIQLILKYHVYDPIIQFMWEGTALHLLVKKDNNMELMKIFQILSLFHVLPNSDPYKLAHSNYLKLRCDENVPSMYSANEISCINLLLQAGIDIWTPNHYTNDFPTPGPMANDEARKWWYDKVVSEVVILKTSISYAANATSVIAALVATGSFIGPFQPPLGYADSNGYIFANRSPVRVYLVCNSLSFFFSIASILMAVLPAIRMPKESLYDELFRSQRCLKVAALMLLISIICILISFSSASIAVVSSEWHEKQLIVACIVFGGGICVVVLVIYIIRLLRMLLHKNDRFRRWFAKHMSF